MDLESLTYPSTKRGKVTYVNKKHDATIVYVKTLGQGQMVQPYHAFLPLAMDASIIFNPNHPYNIGYDGNDGLWQFYFQGQKWFSFFFSLVNEDKKAVAVTV